MPPRSRVALSALMLSAALLLSGCESAEEKAERFYQSGLAFLEAGDEERALIEFRNVFEHDGFHKEARRAYADLQLRRGEEAEAYAQYLRLIEQYPDTADVRTILAEMAVSRNDWQEAQRHGQEALRLAPEDPRAQAIGIALRYRDASLARDMARREEVAREARIALAQDDGLEVLRRVVIDFLASGPNPQDALPEIDRALEADADALDLHMMRFRLLAEADDLEGTGEQLKRMYALFPDNQDIRESLIRWYLVQRDLAGAEAFLRELAGEDTGPAEGHIAVVQLLETAQGTEAAQAELDRLIQANAETANADIYRALRAGLDFEAGRQAEAIAAYEEILANAEPSDQTRQIKAMLARMLASTGNQVGARSRIEEILAEDATNVPALKMRAAWAIREDRPGDAIIDLRTALSQEPSDVEALTLMAEAHERDGSPELAGERLAYAVEVSNAAPEPSLRYAEFLIRQDRPQVAETVLIDANAAHPQDVRVARALVTLWIRQGDFARAEAAIGRLAGTGAPAAQEEAQRLRAALLLAQDRTDEGIEALQALAGASGDKQAVARVLSTMTRAGQVDEARAYLDVELSKDPGNAELRLMDASLHAIAGDAGAAEAGYRELVAADPRAEAPVRLLYQLLRSEGRAEEATAVLDAGLAAQPESDGLQWMKAAELEAAGDIEGAIAIYEELYAQDSGNLIVANNLASLISAHRTDAESLERAWAVARRLRGSDVPAFQDTYGWIAFRRGDLPEALRYLEPAAEGLPEDPLVQFHLGMTYAEMGRAEDAARQLSRAIELAGDSPLPQFQQARERLATLGDVGAQAPAAAPAEEEAPAGGAP